MIEIMSVEIVQLARFFERGKVAFLTGAGVSTDSGIPDYRGKGTPPRTPMNINEFLGEELFRKRFWAGASVNAKNRGRIEPNSGHLVIADLERKGLSSGVITQNVDDLHRRAGSLSLVELHGNGNRVVCLSCGSRFSRAEIIGEFDALNRGYTQSQSGARLNADGDAEVTNFESVTVPQCTVCGGTLRPDIVYFGETVPSEVFESAKDIVENSEALIVAGSSLAVNTGVRIVHRAQREQKPVAVINRGPTAIDGKVQLRLEAGTTETLKALSDFLQ